MKRVVKFTAVLAIVALFTTQALAIDWERPIVLTELPAPAMGFVTTSDAAPGERHRLDSFADVYESVAHSVVSIITRAQRPGGQGGGFDFDLFAPWGFDFGAPHSGEGEGAPVMREVRGAGSGIIFFEDDDDVYIVTNFHVVDGANACYVTLDDQVHVAARFIGGDEPTDIAVIAVSRADLAAAGVTGYRPALFGYSENMRIGDQVMAVGNALGAGRTATMGIVSAKNRPVFVENVHFNAIQTDASINRGNSGGPLVNMAGAVIGINTAKFASAVAEGVGYAIPSTEFIGIIENIMENGGSKARPFLGVTTRFQTNDYGGALIIGVAHNTAAYEMGLMADDVVISLNGAAVPDRDSLIDLINQTPAGAPIEMEVVREGETLTLTGYMGRRAFREPEF